MLSSYCTIIVRFNTCLTAASLPSTSCTLVKLPAPHSPHMAIIASPTYTSHNSMSILLGLELEGEGRKGAVTL